MAVNCGTATFSGGTGTKTIAIGQSATWIELEFGGSNIKHSRGFVYGGNQYCFSDDSSTAVSGKAIQVKDNSGNIILEGTWTSFASNNVNFNVTTAPTTMPQVFIKFGN